MASVKDKVWNILVTLSTVLPKSVRNQMCRLILSAYGAQADKTIALRDLFSLKDCLDYHLDQVAIQYGKGIHPKHVLMNYHRFFCERILPSSSVLDVGCGYGVVAASMVQTGAKVTGIDLSAESIDDANLRYKAGNIRFVVGDATRDLPDEKYDVIVLSNVLEHISDRKALLLRLVGKYSPEKILVRVPMVNRDWSVMMKKELGMQYFSDPTHCIEYTEESFIEEMNNASLKVIHLEIKWGEIWAELVAR